MDFITRNIAHNAFVTPAATATYIGTVTGGASASYVSGAVTIPASTKPRLVVFAMTYANTTLNITSANLGNYPLTVTNYVGAGDTNTVAIGYGVIPASVSGSQTAYAYFSGVAGASSGGIISVYVCDNISSPTPVATFTSDIASFPVSISLTSKTNGVAIGVFGTSGGTSGNVTWTNFTEDYDASANSRAASSAHGITDSTTFTGALNNTITDTNRSVMVMTFR